jgi:glycosyltransferase involved in cell wall biosynthesis
VPEDLHLGLDVPLPTTVAAGASSALFVCGRCFSEQGSIGNLAFSLDGELQPVVAHGMPRSDVFDVHDSAPGSFRSGFWGVLQLPPTAAGHSHKLLLRATLTNGTQLQAPIAHIEVESPPDPLPVPAPDSAPLAAAPLVAICMATYEPPLLLLRRQLDSIRAQTHANWVCIVSDDCSSPRRFQALEREIADDPRFLLSRSSRRLGFYANFERALALAPHDARYLALSDQDDCWHPDKLATLLASLGDAKLVYSDARIVTPEGELVSETYWAERRNNHSDLLSLLVANSVTGAASLFTRDVVDHALPFPPGQFAHFHDHWLGLVALALGDIAFIDRPLYDYVQHAGAVLGHAEANRMPTFRDRLSGLRRPSRERVRRWRLTYFVDACRLLQFATVLKLRCGPEMSRSKRRTLDRFLRTDRSPLQLGRFALRAGRELAGRPETLGAELGLMFGFGWRRLAAASARGRQRPRRRLRIDARPPAKLVQTPGRTGPDNPLVRTVSEKIAPLELAVRDDAPERVNILIPTIDLDHFFGGYIGKLNLARRLADRGARARLVTVDPVGPLPPTWTERLEAYSGLSGLFDRVEVAFGREPQGLEVSRTDRFIATTWWTAHVARHTLDSLGGDHFLYLIQEYEPFTFPMGTYAALASESYTFPHTALFSTELLRDYFRRHGIGVYAQGAAVDAGAAAGGDVVPGEDSVTGDDLSAAFDNAITRVRPPTAAALAARDIRRLLFYARPEPHAARNMFELGMLGLSRALEQGAFVGWELHGIGTVDSQRRIALGGGASLELLPRRGQDSYAELLPQYDVGLALMYTPHPSLVPIEMASAGMLTVTTSFENKTPEAMAAISLNLITVEPTIEGVAGGLLEAAAGVEDAERRVQGSDVHWSRDWETSFDDALMERIEGLLERD